MRGGALEGADPQVSDRALGKGIEVDADGLHPRKHRACMGEQHPACLGQLDGSRAGESIEDASSSDALEVGDLLTHGGLGIPKLLGRGTERPMPGHGIEGDQVSKLKPSEAISTGDL